MWISDELRPVLVDIARSIQALGGVFSDCFSEEMQRATTAVVMGVLRETGVVERLVSEADEAAWDRGRELE